MKEPKDATFLVFDHGLFLPLALELAKTAKRVIYHNAAQVDAFPTLAKSIVGDGYDNIEVTDEPFSHRKEIDCAVFPDIYEADKQSVFEELGVQVWGSRDGDKLEIYRGRFLKALAEVGLEVPEHRVLTGLSSLGASLMELPEAYVKISRFRGTMETFHWRGMAEDEDWLHMMAVKLGPAKENMVFYVFEPIDTDIEVGCDTFTIGGRVPEEVLVGYEMKDRSYFGAVTHSRELPQPLFKSLDLFSPEMEGNRYRNFISTEVRIKGDHFYFIDPTRRAGVPSGLSQFKLYANLPEIILAGAQGELVQPELNAKFSCECIMTAKGEKTCWTVVDFPEGLRDSIGCPGSCQIDGRICWPPDDSGEHEIGWLHSMADTPKECIQGMLDKAADLPDGVIAATESLADLLKEIESGKSQGVPFTSKPLPEPAVVVEDQPTT